MKLLSLCLLLYLVVKSREVSEISMLLGVISGEVTYLITGGTIKETYFDVGKKSSDLFFWIMICIKILIVKFDSMEFHILNKVSKT